MRAIYLAMLLLAAPTSSFAADPPPIPKSDGKIDPAPKAPVIKFLDVAPAPKIDPSPTPSPAPAPIDPAAIAKLTPDVVYVALQSETPFLIRASPANLVRITKMEGPFVFRGKFSDGNGGYETRKFSAKFTAFVEGAGVGRVELIANPVGSVDEKDDIRKLLDVDDGTKPIPPPKPEPIPPPKPKPPTPPPDPQPALVGTGGFIVVVADDSNMTPAAAKLYDCPTLRAYKTAGKCRVYGSVVDASKLAALKYDVMMATEKASAPCVLVVDKGGHYVAAFALPETETELAAKLKEAMAP